VKMDDRGRILVPLAARETVGITPQTPILLVANPEERNIVLTPIPEAARLVSLQVKLPDRPGALAKAAQVVAEHGVDLLMTESRTLSRGAEAEWNAVADFAKARSSPEEVARALMETGAAKKAQSRELSPR